jgi:hypothetical protein
MHITNDQILMIGGLLFCASVLWLGISWAHARIGRD